jgi:1-deoxy-D-xylulose-5-phosphate reductoisomerase
VEAFLEERLPFPGIAEIVEETLERVPVRAPGSIEELLAIDHESRLAARRLVEERVAAAR